MTSGHDARSATKAAPPEQGLKHGQHGKLPNEPNHRHNRRLPHSAGVTKQQLPLLFIEHDGLRSQNATRAAIGSHVQKVLRIQSSKRQAWKKTGTDVSSKLSLKDSSQPKASCRTQNTNKPCAGGDNNSLGPTDDHADEQARKTAVIAHYAEFLDSRPAETLVTKCHSSELTGWPVSNSDSPAVAGHRLSLCRQRGHLCSTDFDTDRFGATYTDKVRACCECFCHASSDQKASGLRVGHVSPHQRIELLPPLEVLRTSDLITIDQAWSILHRYEENLKQFLPVQASTRSDTVSSMMRMVSTDWMSFASRIYIQSLRDTLDQRPHARRISMEYYSRLLQAINSAMSDVMTACSDSTLFTVLALSTHDPTNTWSGMTIPRHRPNQGPLKMLKQLHVHGGPIDTYTVHFDAFLRLLAMRGGISRISLPGFSWLLSYAEILRGSKNLEVSMVGFYTEIDPEAVLLKSRHQIYPLSTLGRGFDTFFCSISDSSTSFTTGQAVWLALERLALYTRCIDDHLAHRPQCESLAVMGELRDYVQHGLLTLLDLRTGNIPDADVMMTALYAGLIYSYTCVFPIIVAPFEELARRIAETSVFSNIDGEYLLRSPRFLHVAIWILCMGGIASIGSTALRSWYITMLKTKFREAGISSWSQLKTILMDFLWFPATNDPDGQHLCHEVFSTKESPEQLDMAPFLAIDYLSQA